MMKSLLVLVGPTGSGKTALAERLAAEAPVRLVSADSQQVYRGLDLGTAKPGPAARAAWGLVDVADLGESYSAGAFCRQAAPLCEEAWAAGRTPVLCGGTGLYLRALLQGLPDLPPTPRELREALGRERHERGLEPLIRRLEAVDPDLARTVDRGNPRRVLRGLEVYELTGRPLSAWQSERADPALVPDRVLWLGLDPGREELNLRLAGRVDRCLEAGWLEEVEALAGRHGDAALMGCVAIGYAELLDHLRGRRTLEAARAALLGRTRQYARRQRIWFRAVPGVAWAEEPEPLLERARRFMEPQLQ